MEYTAALVGKTIRRLRLICKQSQEVFSGLAGIERSHLAKIERGEKAANVETLAKIAHAFDIRLSDLFLEIEKDMETPKE